MSIAICSCGHTKYRHDSAIKLGGCEDCSCGNYNFKGKIMETNTSDTLRDEIADLRTRINRIDSMLFDLWEQWKMKQVKDCYK